MPVLTHDIHDSTRIGDDYRYVRDKLSKRKDFPPAIRIGSQLRWMPEDIELRRTINPSVCEGCKAFYGVFYGASRISRSLPCSGFPASASSTAACHSPARQCHMPSSMHCCRKNSLIVSCHFS